MTGMRRALSFLLVLCAASALAVAGRADAQENGKTAVVDEPRFFTIGTGGAGGTYFAVGGLIANIISHPPGSRTCDEGGNCGVPGLIAAAQSTQGSVQNVHDIATGRLDSGLVQADIAYWAYHGEASFKDDGPRESLRAIANLYPESLHIVTRRGAGIANVEDLAGRRVALGALKSGTLVDARLVLRAYGLSEKRIKPFYQSVDEAATALRRGEIDAFFFVAGAPAPAIATLAENSIIELLQVAGPPGIKLHQRYPFFQRSVIPAGAYKGVIATQTIAVGAQWVVSAELDEELVYQITKALWHPFNRPLLMTGHPQARNLSIETALNGVAIPLHPGAERYYKEVGKLPAD